MDWKTWSPFQSEKIKNICSYMTEEEKKKSAQFGAKSGILVAIFLPYLYHLVYYGL
ncbi:hypothetical protein ACFL49_00075 [Candidatus Omnitrophota bacterium]